MKPVKKAINDIYYNDAGFETLFGSRRSGCTYYEVRKLEEEVKSQKNRADVYKRCYEILLKRNKLMLKTLEDLKGSARWERHLNELDLLIAIGKGFED